MYLLSAKSVLFPTSMIMTSLPLSVLTSSIHFEVCWRKDAPQAGGEIKLREWQQNNSVVLFNDNNQHYSAVLQTHFRVNNWSMAKIIQQHQHSMRKTVKIKTYFGWDIVFLIYTVSWSETQDRGFAGWGLLHAKGWLWTLWFPFILSSVVKCRTIAWWFGVPFPIWRALFLAQYNLIAVTHVPLLCEDQTGQKPRRAPRAVTFLWPFNN